MFDVDPEDAGELNEARLARWRARAKRDSVFLSVPIFQHGRAVATGRVRNISATGMLVECADGLAVGSVVSADIRGIGLKECTVVRAGAGLLGLSFGAPIDPQLCRKSVLPKPPNPSRDWKLHLREPYKEPRWRS